jgi:hypothetical protein
VVEEIFRNEEPSPETNARLLEQIKRLLAEREGLAVLSDHVRRRDAWPSGNPFLDLLSQGMLVALEGGGATKHGEAFQALAAAIIRSCDPDDRPHQAMLPILRRLNNDAYLDAVRRDLFQLWERDRQRDAFAVVQRVLGPSMPQRDWHATLKKLLEKTADQALKAKLREALHQLGRDPGQAPTETKDAAEDREGIGAASGREQALTMKTPQRSPDVPTAKPPLTPSPRKGGERSAEEDRPGDSGLAVSPANTLPTSERRPAAEEATDERAKARPRAQAESVSGSTGEPSSHVPGLRADFPAAAPWDRGDGRAESSSEISVTANGPGVESVTNESPVAEEPASRASTQPTGGPGGPSGAGEGAPASGPIVEAPSPAASAVGPDTEVTERPGAPRAEEPSPSGDHATAAVPGPASEPSPSKRKTSRAKRATKSVAPPEAEAAANPAPGANLSDLVAYLAEVTQRITGLFRDRDSDRQEFLARCALVEKENEYLKAKLAEAERDAGTTASALEAARASSTEQLARISALGSQLDASREATRKAEERARQLDKDLEDALREIEETERRAGDRVHRAEKEKELGVRTFRFELKKRIQPYLTEVLDDGGEPPELSPDQSRLHQRLRKILGALRDTGVMEE